MQGWGPGMAISQQVLQPIREEDGGRGRSLNDYRIGPASVLESGTPLCCSYMLVSEQTFPPASVSFDWDWEGG